MGFLPKTMGTRPRLACEMRAEGVVAARADDSSALLNAVERVTFAHGAASADRAANTSRAEMVAAVRDALDAVSQRGREVTLVVPDTAVRVLLVDFDELPAKPSEALPVVRFRLKKLLPFDADEAAVSYQVLSQTRAVTQVLAVAMPRETLAEYEGLVREAGYEPGAVLPSTLAALAGLAEDAAPSLMVNAGLGSVTTAIVQGGVLLLHRTVDLGGGGAATAVIPNAGEVAARAALVDASASARGDETAREATRDTTIAAIAARFAAMEGQTMPAPRAPDAPQVSRMGSALASGMAAQDASAASAPSATGAQRSVQHAEEIAQAVSVAAAYFEDTLGMSPKMILSAGPLGAEALARMLGPGSPQVDETVGLGMLDSGVSGEVPTAWLAGVRGALRS